MQLRRSITPSVALLAVILVPVVTFAQTGELSGLVTDPAGVPVAGAIVEVVGVSEKTRTSEQGEFRVTGVPTGIAEIHFRRLGFAAVTRSARVEARGSTELNIVLQAVPTLVQPVVVQAAQVAYHGRLAGYYERLHRRSSGSFITRAELDRNENKTLSQLLATTPGVTAMRGGGGVRMRGMRCRPLVWLDGVPMPAGEVDLDAFPVSTLHGVEMYLGATNAPSAYQPPPGLSACGTVLLWSRGRDTETSEISQASMDLEALAASHAIFTPEEVDSPARLEGQSLEVSYPADLAASRISGSVVAEFVVSETGEIERGSMDIVSATHPLFARAAMQALTAARFAPARKAGVPVRQLVQQPFNFSLDAEVAPPSARR